jgi:hypothetical protein
MRTHEPETSPEGSPVMLRMSPSVSDLAGLAGSPSPSPSVEDLYAAAGAYTGLGAASPHAAEIVDMVMSTVAVMLAGRSSPDGGSTPRWHDDMPPPAASWAWPELTGTKRGRTRLSLAPAPAPPVDGQMCAVFAVDIAGFTRPDRDDDIRRYLHEKLYEYLREAFEDSGLPWQECFGEDRGDGALIVVPPGISFKGLIYPLPERLRGLIRRHNHVSRDTAGLQLRTAIHVGPVDHDGHGFVGTDVNFTFRLLEARSLKRVLAASGAELGVAVSDYVYRSLVCRYPSLVHPDAFRAIRFQTKNTRAQAWTYLPGTSS